MLFDRLEVARPVPDAAPAVLIIGGAGGVGSMAVQLARQLTDLTVLATASRPESRAWAASLGAHHVLDHARPLAAQVEALGIGAPGLVFSTTHTGAHIGEIAALIAPQGRFGYIDDITALDPTPFKGKSVSIRLESMFTRPVYGTEDMDAQHAILDEVARLVDAGQVQDDARGDDDADRRGQPAQGARAARGRLDAGKDRAGGLPGVSARIEGMRQRRGFRRD